MNSPNLLHNKIHIALNKPIDYEASGTNEHKKSVLELLTAYNGIQKDARDIREPLCITEHLDADSEGLVLLTDDGNLTNLLNHPNFEHQKEYEVILTNALSKDAKKVLEHGMKLDHEFMEGIKIKKEFNKGKLTIVTIIVKKTDSRQIRAMFTRLGYRINALRRTRLGKLRMGTLGVGKWKFVSRHSIV